MQPPACPATMTGIPDQLRTSFILTPEVQYELTGIRVRGGPQTSVPLLLFWVMLSRELYHPLSDTPPPDRTGKLHKSKHQLARNFQSTLCGCGTEVILTRLKNRRAVSRKFGF